MRQDKYAVYGEYGGYFTNMREAKACAREASEIEGSAEVWLIADGCCYIEYENGKLTRDGWTIKK